MYKKREIYRMEPEMKFWVDILVSSKTCTAEMGKSYTLINESNKEHTNANATWATKDRYNGQLTHSVHTCTSPQTQRVYF